MLKLTERHHRPFSPAAYGVFVHNVIDALYAADKPLKAAAAHALIGRYPTLVSHCFIDGFTVDETINLLQRS